MVGAFDLDRVATSARSWEAIFLTLILFLLPFENACAFDDSASEFASMTEAGRTPNPTYDDTDNGHRTAALLHYVREQLPALAPGLDQKLHSTVSWLKSVGGGFTASTDRALNDTGMPTMFQPLTDMMDEPSQDQAQAMWLTPGYHHKGFLPFHDAMMTGMNFRQRAFGDGVQFDFQPFYGQSWTSLNGYGGAQIGIALIHSRSLQPWGRIALGYTDGAANMVSENRGTSLVADLKFNDNLSFHAELRSNPEGDLGNFAILKWKLAEFGR